MVNISLVLPISIFMEVPVILMSSNSCRRSGTANASGTWMAKDDDEIAVTLDATNANITVDPSSLTLGYATLTDTPATELETWGLDRLSISDAFLRMAIIWL